MSTTLKSGTIYDANKTQADYKRLFEESPIPMLIYNSASMRFLDVNAAAMQQYGYPKEEFLKLAVHDIRPEEANEPASSVLKMPALNRFYDSGMRMHKKKNGEVFHTQIYSYAIPFNGRIARAMIAMDIKSGQILEEQAEQLNNIISYQQRRLNDLISSAHEVSWTANAENYTLTGITPSCCNVCGYTDEELLNREQSLFTMVHPDDRQLITDAHRTLLQTGQATVECRVQHKDGSVKYVINEASLQPRVNDTPAVIKCLTVDITQLRREESKFQSDTQDNETVLERITESFFSVDRNWRFTYVNRELENTLQLHRDELIGKELWEVFPHVANLKIYDEYHRAFNEQVSVHFEDFAPLLRKWFNINAYPTDTGLAVYMRDITEEKKQSVKIQAQTDKLKEIAWIQSHRVRGPVASIMGLIELFNTDNLGDPANKEILENLKVATYSLDGIIKEIVEKTNMMEG